MGRTVDMPSLNDEKAALRRRMRSLRLVVDQKDGPIAAQAVAGHFLAARESMNVGTGSVVGGYWPIGTELDLRPLLAKLDALGVTCALPVVSATDTILTFRHWRPLDAVERGPLGTMHPAMARETVVPSIVFTPMLAVDPSGNRLGTGGGYYDRTLARLRAAGDLVAIGAGFGVQKIDFVPHGPHDQKMDWILTDDGLVAVAS